MSRPGDAFRDDLAPYLLGALPEERGLDLDRHLAGCAPCREELEWLRPATQLLGESVEQLGAPRGLRGRVLAAARAEARPRRASTPAGGRLWNRRRPMAVLAATASLALIAAGIAGYALRGGGTEEEMLASAGRSPSMTATLMRKGDAGMLRLANVETMPHGRVLEAWARRDGRLRPVGGLFEPDRGGHAVTMIPDVGEVDAVLVTAEPRGGSPVPTSAPLVTLTLSR